MKKLSKKWKITLGILGAATIAAGTAVATVACGAPTTPSTTVSNFVTNNSKITLSVPAALTTALADHQAVAQADQSALNTAFSTFLSSSKAQLPSNTTASEFTIDWSSANGTSSSTFKADITYTPKSGSAVNSTTSVTFTVSVDTQSSTTPSTIVNEFVTKNSAITLSLSSALSLTSGSAISSTDQTTINSAFTTFLNSSKENLPASTTSSEFKIDWTDVKAASTSTFKADITYTPKSGSAVNSTTSVTFTLETASK